MDWLKIVSAIALVAMFLILGCWVQAVTWAGKLGEYVIKAWSSAQASLALSSGEAEYYGVVRGAAVGLGQHALGRGAGFDLPVRVWTDSSAAMGWKAVRSV